MVKKIICLLLSLSIFITPIQAAENYDWSNDDDFIVSLESQKDEEFVFNFTFINEKEPLVGDKATVQLPKKYLKFNDTEEISIYAFEKDTGYQTDCVLGKMAIKDNVVEIVFTNNNANYYNNIGKFSVTGIFLEGDFIGGTDIWELNDQEKATIIIPEQDDSNSSVEENESSLMEETDVNGSDESENSDKEVCLEENNTESEETIIDSEQLITYESHIENLGWMPSVADGEMSGTQGKNLHMEALRIYLNSPAELTGGIEYRVHVQDMGWLDWVSSGEIAGTTGKNLQIEAIQIRLNGQLEEKYDIYYRVHITDYGTLGWAKNGSKAGSESMVKAVQSIEIKLQEKNSPDISNSNCYLGPDRMQNFSYKAKIGSDWQEDKNNGEIVGTTGQNKALSGINLQLSSFSGAYSGTIQYQVHFSNVGWTNTFTNGVDAISNNNNIEAIKINLTDEMAKYCDVYYRTHVSNLGWLGWAKNGQPAGTTKLAYNMEAIEIKIVPKGKYVGPNTNYYKDTIASPIMIKAHSVNQSIGSNLRAAFDYAKQIRYSRYEPADNNAYGSENYANYGFSTGRGNCYVMAAVFSYLAKDLGYDAHQVGGFQGSHNTPHSWVEIEMDGTTYVFDPDFELELGRNGFMITYGSSGTLKYHSYSRMN